jgi:hypothetical protein
VKVLVLLVSAATFFYFGEIMEGLCWVGDRNQAGTDDREHRQKSNAYDGSSCNVLKITNWN